MGDEPGAERIVRRKLSDQVFERLHAMIGGELKPGDVLPSERDLMERFGVGRPAIREALQSLQNKGLITIAHGERSRVNVLSTDLAVEQMNEVARLLLSTEPSNLEYLKQARRLFETGVVGIAARYDLAPVESCSFDGRLDLGLGQRSFMAHKRLMHVPVPVRSARPHGKRSPRGLG